MTSKSVLLSLALAAFAGVYGQEFDDAIPTCCRPDVVFILDRAYMGPRKYRSFARPLLTNFTQVVPDCADLRASIVEYATEAKISFDFATYTPKSTLSEAVNVFSTTPTDLGFDAQLGLALRATRVELLTGTMSGHREDSPATIVLITGTTPLNQTQATIQADFLKGLGVRIIVVGLGVDYDVEFVRSLASRPEWLFEYPDNDIFDAVSLSNRIYMETCNSNAAVDVADVMNGMGGDETQTEPARVFTTPEPFVEEFTEEQTTRRPTTRRTTAFSFNVGVIFGQDYIDQQVVVPVTTRRATTTTTTPEPFFLTEEITTRRRPPPRPTTPEPLTEETTRPTRRTTTTPEPAPVYDTDAPVDETEPPTEPPRPKTTAAARTTRPAPTTEQPVTAATEEPFVVETAEPVFVVVTPEQPRVSPILNDNVVVTSTVSAATTKPAEANANWMFGWNFDAKPPAQGPTLINSWLGGQWNGSQSNNLLDSDFFRQIFPQQQQQAFNATPIFSNIFTSNQTSAERSVISGNPSDFLDQTFFRRVLESQPLQQQQQQQNGSNALLDDAFFRNIFAQFNGTNQQQPCSNKVRPCNSRNMTALLLQWPVMNNFQQANHSQMPNLPFAAQWNFGLNHTQLSNIFANFNMSQPQQRQQLANNVNFFGNANQSVQWNNILPQQGAAWPAANQQQQQQQPNMQFDILSQLFSQNNQSQKQGPAWNQQMDVLTQIFGSFNLSSQARPVQQQNQQRPSLNIPQQFWNLNQTNMLAGHQQLPFVQPDVLASLMNAGGSNNNGSQQQLANLFSSNKNNTNQMPPLPSFNLADMFGMANRSLMNLPAIPQPQRPPQQQNGLIADFTMPDFNNLLGANQTQQASGMLNQDYFKNFFGNQQQNASQNSGFFGQWLMGNSEPKNQTSQRVPQMPDFNSLLNLPSMAQQQNRNNMPSLSMPQMPVNFFANGQAGVPAVPSFGNAQAGLPALPPFQNVYVENMFKGFSIPQMPQFFPQQQQQPNLQFQPMPQFGQFFFPMEQPQHQMTTPAVPTTAAAAATTAASADSTTQKPPVRCRQNCGMMPMPMQPQFFMMPQIAPFPVNDFWPF